MSLIRAYQKACSSQLNTWKVYKRLAVTRYSLEYFSSLYKADQYLPPVDFSETEEGKQCSEYVFVDWIKRINLTRHTRINIEINLLKQKEHTIISYSALKSCSFIQYTKSWCIR